MVNFGLLTAEICRRVWCTPGNFNGFRVRSVQKLQTAAYTLQCRKQQWPEHPCHGNDVLRDNHIVVSSDWIQSGVSSPSNIHLRSIQYARCDSTMHAGSSFAD